MANQFLVCYNFIYIYIYIFITQIHLKNCISSLVGGIGSVWIICRRLGNCRILSDILSSINALLCIEIFDIVPCNLQSHFSSSRVIVLSSSYHQDSYVCVSIRFLTHDIAFIAV